MAENRAVKSLLGWLILGGVLVPMTAAGAEAQVDDNVELRRELRGVEQEINTLKERVFRSKATLQLLRELILEGDSTGSRVVIRHQNKMGPAYTLESIEYLLDGKTIMSRADPDGGLDEERELLVLEQALPPGKHLLEVRMLLRGDGMGVFSYLKSYSFRVQSAYEFTVTDDQRTTIEVVADERGGPLRSFVERPHVKYIERAEGRSEAASP